LLFRRHALAIRRYAARRLGPDAAENIVAEVFLAAFRQRGQYRPGQPDARPWLYGIASRLISRHRRSEVRLLRALARTGTDPVTEPFTDRVDDRVTAAEPPGRWPPRWPGCPPRTGTPAADRLGRPELQGTAVRLGVPVGTVRSRVSRARTRLRQALAGQPGLAGAGPAGAGPPAAGPAVAGGPAAGPEHRSPPGPLHRLSPRDRPARTPSRR
jgi:RNA polymerase sigma-70 factor (ECF subfamily)